MKKQTQHIDLFEDYENIPANVQKVLDKYEEAFMDGAYDGLLKAHKAVNKWGYTFEYYLDGQAYGLRPNDVPLNKLKGYEDEPDEMTDSGEIQFKEGGSIDETDLLKSYDIWETFSTKEFGLKHNISTALAYKKLCALEDMDLVFKYGYKTRNGWTNPNSILSSFGN